jgi:hypothetical protein
LSSQLGAAAAGVLLTATGTAGALLFVLWAGTDRLYRLLRPEPKPITAVPVP